MIPSGGINDGNADGIGLGAQTGFGFSQNSQGGLDATAQLGGNVQVKTSLFSFTLKDLSCQYGVAALISVSESKPSLILRRGSLS